MVGLLSESLWHMCMEVLRKTMKASVRTEDVPVGIQIELAPRILAIKPVCGSQICLKFQPTFNSTLAVI
jgi:hypothetical protein